MKKTLIATSMLMGQTLPNSLRALEEINIMNLVPIKTPV